jgi:signal transduction histidine kinase
LKTEARHLRVLLIEDDEDDYFVMKKCLSEVSSQVFELAWVTDYNRGLEAINSSRYDICFLDYRLGGHDGVELLRSVNGRESVPPIVLLTSFGDYRVDLEAMKAGAADYLDKRLINAPLLERTIRYALERRRTQERLRRANRALETLNECNQILVRSTEERDLLSAICRIIVEVGGYRLAWVGFAEDDAKKTVRPVARAGFEDGYLDTVEISWADNQRGRGPTGAAVRTGKTSINRNTLEGVDYAPWRAEALKRQFASSVSIPLSLEGNTCFGALTIYSDRIDAFDGDEVSLLETLSKNISYGIGSIRAQAARKRSAEALRHSEGQLKLLSARLITAQEEERKRISRELHDSIGSLLAIIKFSLEGFRKQCPVPNPLENIISMTQRATDETRRIMTALRPSILDDLGLSAAIAWFCREYQIIYPSISVETAFEIDESEIPEALKTPIFRIVQEAFNNIAKHSNAERANLVVRQSNGMLELVIEDSGSGFIPDDVVLSHGEGRGIGVSSMRERADLSGGALSIKTAPGKGTTVCASWPCG